MSPPGILNYFGGKPDRQGLFKLPIFIFRIVSAGAA
jgi:hypothetical protein